MKINVLLFPIGNMTYSFNTCSSDNGAAAGPAPRVVPVRLATTTVRILRLCDVPKHTLTKICESRRAKNLLNGFWFGSSSLGLGERPRRAAAPLLYDVRPRRAAPLGSRRSLRWWRADGAHGVRPWTVLRGVLAMWAVLVLRRPPLREHRQLQHDVVHQPARARVHRVLAD